MNRNKYYQLNYLSAEFYNVYENVEYPEIENKITRPYVVVLVKIQDNTFAIPFRTNISHKNCYKFKNSTRPTDSVTGLDYTKAVVVNKQEFIGGAARINDAEYLELNDKFQFIIKQFKAYLSDYVKYVSGNDKYYAGKKFKYTTLKYFHKELGFT